MKTKLTILAALAATGVLTHAIPVQWDVASGGNGHWYEAVPWAQGATWTDANAIAQAKGGYLADVHSAAENALVFGLIDDPAYWVHGSVGGFSFNDGPWIGGYQADTSVEPAGNFIWTSTGDSLGYSNWGSGQPDDVGGNEDYIKFFTPNATDISQRSDTWNDAPNVFSSYIVEYNSKPASVPDGGGTASLMALALCALGFLRPTKKR